MERNTQRITVTFDNGCGVQNWEKLNLWMATRCGEWSAVKMVFPPSALPYMSVFGPIGTIDCADNL